MFEKGLRKVTYVQRVNGLLNGVGETRGWDL